MSDGARPSPLRVALALFALYVVWGSTYLAIRWIVETGVSLLWTASLRFALAAALMLAAAAARGEARPTRAQFGNAAVGGTLMFVVSNGLVMWGQQTVASGLTALLVATTPLWLLGFEAVGGARTGPRGVAGVVVGLVGVGVLVEPSTAGVDPWGAGAILTACVAWALGTMWGKHRDLPGSALGRSGWQMAFAAVVLAGVAAAAGDPVPWPVPTAAIGPFLWLLFAGSIVGFGAFTWLLSVTRPTVATTYAYVNPVIAVLLGAWFAGERLPGRAAVGAALIVGAVVLVTTANSTPRRAT